MKIPASYQSQRGVTLFVGLILLVLITLMVTTAFTLSNTNLKSVGNMQSRDEAVAAANMAIEQVMSSNFTNLLAEENKYIDINNDGVTDYVVRVPVPVCVRASIDTSATLSSVSLGASMSTSYNWNTLWDIQAIVNDTKTGAKTTVHAGTRVLLTQVKKNLLCI